MWAASHRSQLEPTVVLCGSHNQAVQLKSGQWMKGISSPSVFKWFVQNRKTTTHCRT